MGLLAWIIGAFVVLPMFAAGASFLILGVTAPDLLAAVVGAIALGLSWAVGQWVIEKS